MSKNPKPMPDDDQLRALVPAAVASAARYLKGAKQMLEAELWSLGYIQAAYGLEEIGKGNLCLIAYMMPPEIREQFRPDFMKAFTGHEQKAQVGQLIYRMLSDDEEPDNVFSTLDRINREGTETNDRKFAALYTDAVPGGASEPSTAASPEQAQGKVRELELAMTAMTPFAVDNPNAITAAEMETFRQMVTRVLGSLGTLYANDPNGFFLSARSMMRTGTPTSDLAALLASAFPNELTSNSEGATSEAG